VSFSQHQPRGPLYNLEISHGCQESESALTITWHLSCKISALVGLLSNFWQPKNYPAFKILRGKKYEPVVILGAGYWRMKQGGMVQNPPHYQELPALPDFFRLNSTFPIATTRETSQTHKNLSNTTISAILQCTQCSGYPVEEVL
jgi:hypothetical protein